MFRDATRGAADPKCSVPFAPGETTRRPGDKPRARAPPAMAMPRRRDGEDGEAPRDETEFPSRARSSESGESGDAGALAALSAPDSAWIPRIPPRPAGVGPRARPSRSEGDAGGTGSVVSNAMKSPSPLSEFCLLCAFFFSFVRASSALGLRRTTRGLPAFAEDGGGKPEEGGSGVKTAPGPGSEPPGGYGYVFCSVFCSALAPPRTKLALASCAERRVRAFSPGKPFSPSIVLVAPSSTPVSTSASRLAATRRSKSATETRSISSAAFSRSTEELRRRRRTNTSEPSAAFSPSSASFVASVALGFDFSPPTSRRSGLAPRASRKRRSGSSCGRGSV